MASIKELSVGKSEMFRFDPKIIKVQEEFNERLNNAEREERIQTMVQSILANGIQTPLRVRLSGDDLYVVSGHTRLEAVRRINENSPGTIQTILATVESKTVSEADRKFSIYIDNDGQPLAPVEKANLFKKMIDVYGWSVEQIAQKAGISEKQINNLLSLSGASDEVKELISKGDISATTAVQIIKKEGDGATAKIKEVVDQAKASGKTKATAKTMGKAPTNFAADLLSGNVTPQPDAPKPPKPSPATVDGYNEFVDVMNECLILDDVTVIHTVIRDMLLTKNALRDRS